MEPARLLRALHERGVTLAVAESCTGGLVLARLTAVAGASGVVWGGAVVYSAAAKAVLAGVQRALIEQQGSVSEPVTRALAEGIRRVSGADVGAAVTGWAGPEHGVEPVGTVYLAVAGRDGCRSRRHRFEGDREQVRAQAAGALCGFVYECVTAGDG